MLGAILVLCTAVTTGAQTDCASLPSSAQRPRVCNPQEECLKLTARGLEGPALEDAKKSCRRHPTSGTCYGPERYNPQEECRARQKR